MVPYIFKVVHVDGNTRKLLPIRNNRRVYYSVENNCSGYYGTVLPDEGYWCGMVLPKIAVFRIKNVPKSKYSVLTYIHIGGI